MQSYIEEKQRLLRKQEVVEMWLLQQIWLEEVQTLRLMKKQGQQEDYLSLEQNITKPSVLTEEYTKESDYNIILSEKICLIMTK